MPGVGIMRAKPGVRTMRTMPRMILRGERRGQQGRRGKQSSAHHEFSGNGRTVTTCIIPACMW
ncbi:hypothetical protein MACH24_22800 [Erythrobacter sp. Dej080120_24]|nr:hypothetical protein MACH24_22800 [Erythrobacter sp. Dej080120_24]